MTGPTSLSSGEQTIGIHASALSFSYGTKRIFERVGFDIPEGQVWALMGRSGVGKSTLLNVILGLYRASSGIIRVGSVEVTRPGKIQGVVFSDSSLLWWLTVKDNLLFPLHKSHDRNRLARVRELLELGGLPDMESLHPKELSTGMRRRVEVLRAFMIDDRYFVADEPFTALDVQSRLALYDLWRKLRAIRPRTGIICTHDPVEAAVLCDAVIMMSNPAAGRSEIEVLKVPQHFRSGEAAKAIYTDPFLTTLVSAIR